MRTAPIEILEKRFGYFPLRFLWKQKEYRVNSVERTWTQKRGGVTKLCFRVKCGQEMFNLQQNAKQNVWSLNRTKGE